MQFSGESARDNGLRILLAKSIFMAVRTINAMQRQEAEAPAVPASPSEELVVLREIRDALKRD